MFKQKLNADEEMYRLNVEHFIQNEISTHIDDWEMKGDYPASLYKKASDYKLFKIAYENMINNNNLIYVAILNSELTKKASQAIAVALTSPFPILYALHHYGKDLYSQQIITKVLSGDSIIAFGVTEKNAGSDFNQLNSSLIIEDSKAILNGKKFLICNAPHASHLLMTVKVNHHLALCLLEKPADIKIEENKTIGWHALPVTNLYFKNCILNHFTMIGNSSTAKNILFEIFNLERLNMAIIASASAYKAYHHALSYAKSRNTFGKNLIEHQVIKHKLAQMKIKLAAGLSLLNNILFDKNNFSSFNIAIVKKFTTECCDFIVDEAVQILGGHALSKNLSMERLYRDSRILRIAAGSDEMMLEIIGKYISSQEHDIT